MLTRAVFPVAGFGTRFLPASKAIPKELIPLVDKPALQYVVEEAVAAGFTTAIFVTAEGKAAIEDHFDRSLRLEAFLAEKGKHQLLRTVQEVGNLVEVVAVRQKQALGLGHAVLQAASLLGREPFAVLLGDDVIVGESPAIGRLAEVHRQTGASVVAVMEVPAAEISRYGCVAAEPLGDGVFRVNDLVEKPAPEVAPSRWAVIGRYILTPTVLEELRSTPPDASGEIQLTEGLRRTLRREPIYACTFPGKRYDAGNKGDFLRATVELGLSHPELGEAFRNFLEDLARRNFQP
ncbi:UTP--glucose-1-phosphate uridylyltransferase [Thermoanaerobaculum aquaticum]|nr:UTP--glucose-1-phosphate uridylyltransferase [Thermoanaerobaculum aquaticum]